MKNSYIVIAVIVVVAILAFIFGTRKEEFSEPTETGVVNGSAILSDGAYKIDTTKSIIKWSGEYSSGAVEEGSVSLSEGGFMVASGEPFMGTFEIDVVSLEANSNLVLQNYLKGTEFLNVDEYPTATFAINKVLPNPVSGTTTGKYIIDGKLTIKEKTASVSFPATFSQNGNVITAESMFAVNRKEWGLDANKEIKDAIIINLYIEASK